MIFVSGLLNPISGGDIRLSFRSIDHPVGDDQSFTCFFRAIRESEGGAFLSLQFIVHPVLNVSLCDGSVCLFFQTNLLDGGSHPRFQFTDLPARHISLRDNCFRLSFQMTLDCVHLSSKTRFHLSAASIVLTRRAAKMVGLFLEEQ